MACFLISYPVDCVKRLEEKSPPRLAGSLVDCTQRGAWKLNTHLFWDRTFRIWCC